MNRFTGVLRPGWLAMFCTLFLVITGYAQNPTAGPNIDMVSGTDWTTGDPFLQRQNEPSIAVSTRNSSHILAGANDYRSVDLPGLLGIAEQGDAWLGVFKSFDGGQTWRSTLMPGYPLDNSLAGWLSPIHGFQAASDPMVRAGTNGLIYYSGIAFNRGPGGLSEVFIARFIDRNNKENGNPTNEVGSMTNVVPRDPMRYTGTFPVAFGSDDAFLDKPSLAVDIPRSSATCTILVPESNTLAFENVLAGRIYIAYTVLYTPDGDADDAYLPRVPSKIVFRRSSNCGITWSSPIDLSGSNAKDQGSVIAIDPNTGTIYVAWRRFASDGQTDAIMVTKSTDGGSTFRTAVPAVQFPATCAPPPVGNPTQPGCPFDQFSAPGNGAFRTNDYATLAVDGSGRVYLAWTQRQQDGDARIMMQVSQDGMNWSSSPVAPIDNGVLYDDYGNPLQTILGRGHQLMPSLSFNAGKLTLAYYDLREDHTIGIFKDRPDPGCDPTTQFPCTLGAQYDESRDQVGELLTNPAFVFNSYITDALVSQGGTLSTRRHTMEVVAAQASPTSLPTDVSIPSFVPFRVSKYAFGTFPEVGINDVEQLQFNPPDLPLFVKGTTAFVGDYIEVAGAPTMIFDKNQNAWRFNTAARNSAFHVVWADNRDVRPPLDGNWQNYVPPYSASNPQGTTNRSKFDPTQTVPQCIVGVNDSNVGMRNQNIYTSQVTNGLVVSSLQSSKPLLNNGQPGIQRAFAVTAQNATNAARSFQWTVRVIPATAAVVVSFDQFNPAITTKPVVNIPAFSSVSLPVFVQATGTTAVNTSVEVDVTENVANNPLQGSVVLNSDPSNPTLLNPDNAVFGNGTITNAEYYNPLLGTAVPGNVSNNTTLLNPGQGNPGQGNPGQGNPGQGNNGYTNPNVIATLGNPGQGNTVLLNPGQGNNSIANPGQGNPGQGNTAVADETFPITNQGNTSATYSVKLFPTAPLPQGITIQLMLSKLYATTRGGTAAEGTACQLVTELNTVPIASVISPSFSSASDLTNPGQGNPGQGNPGQGNPTLALAPGESGQVVIRIAGPKGSQTPPAPNEINQVLSSLTPVVVSQAVNTVDAQRGSTQPPVSGPGSPIVILNTLPGGANPLPDGVNGNGYKAQLMSIGGVGSVTWNLTGETSLTGSGLTLSPSGLISGTAANTGNHFITVLATDSATPTPNTATANLEIRIAAPLLITTVSPLPTATQGMSYGPVTFSESGGIGPYSWTPVTVDGLTLNSSGVFSGIPMAAGTFTFTAQVTDSAFPAQTFGKQMTVSVVPTLLFITTALPGGVVGQPYNATLQATGGTIPYIWSVNSGLLPVGLTLNPSNGVISGTPTRAGSFSFTVQVTDAASPSNVLQQSLFVAVVDPTKPTFTGTKTGPNQWTYTLTFAPLVNYSIFPVATQNTNLTTITLTGLSGVTSAAGPTSTDFPSGGSPTDLNAINLAWSAAVLNGGTEVVYTHVGPGTGNFGDFRHAFGFTINASGAVNGTAPLGTSGFSRDTTNPLPDSTFNLDITGTTDGPVRTAPSQLQPQLWLGNDQSGDVFLTSTNGAVIIDLPSLSTTGIAWDGSNLYFADPFGNFTKRTSDGKTVLDSFFIGPFGGEDLAWDSKRKVLWRILHTNALQEIDPVAHTVLNTYAIPQSDPGFLVTLGGLGVAYDSTRDRLYVSFCKQGCDTSVVAGLVDIVDPNTGSVSGTLFRTSGFFTGGLAYDPNTDTLWVGDFTTVRNMGLSGNVLSSFTRPSPGGFVDGLEFVPGLTATISFSGPLPSVTLTWSPSTSAVVGYNVYRATVSGGPYTKLTSVPTTTLSFTDTSVTFAQYYYVVTAVGPGNVESANSNEVSVMPIL